MTGRDPGEAHRSATPLELFVDLCFVVAVAQASESLHEALTHGHYASGALRFAARQRVCSAAWRTATAWLMAASAAWVSRRALSITKSWMTPW
ncbi:low temperature requirement protein A [Streptomyces flaveolus]|uniref:low temperature requirement protein A n=1 Tax=Streptomyces flaveolus TaxID=67297 RepID=UPI003F4D65CB